MANVIKSIDKKKHHRLFIRKIIKVSKDSQGKIIAYAKWKEVNECNLGSLKNPNNKIIEVAFEPIDYN